MRPTQRCLLLFAAGVPVALLPAILSEGLWVTWAAYASLALLAAGVDAVLCMPRIGVRVDAPETLYVGSPDPLRIALAPPPLRRADRVEVLVDLHEDLRPQPLRTVALDAGDETVVEVPLVPRRRGTTMVDAVWLRWRGPLGLMRRQLRKRLRMEVPVVPDIRTVRQQALHFFTAHEFLSGLKVERYIGDGTEFDSLREYVPGLDHRSMNWKASARHRKLFCNDYRAERNHQVILAVDTGHLMSEPIAGVPRVDHAINAGLMLSYVCMRTGDRVGWFAFDAKVRDFAKPDTGAGAFRRLQQLTTDLDYYYNETNFTLGLTELSLRLTRRSLVVLLTDFVDTVTAEMMIENVARLSRRHLILFVTLRDPALPEEADKEPVTLDDVYRSVVAGDLVRERELVLRRLTRLGIRCLDTPPNRLTTSLLNAYLESKRRELF